MGQIQKYIQRIVQIGKQSDMDCLSDMLKELIEDTKEAHPEKYRYYKTKLYELAYGKTLNEEMAHEWVENMKPKARWTIEETTNAMKQMGYNFNPIDFYVVANMMYSDNYDLVKDDEAMALRLAFNWLNDADIQENKLYNYYKYVI